MAWATPSYMIEMGIVEHRTMPHCSTRMKVGGSSMAVAERPRWAFPPHPWSLSLAGSAATSAVATVEAIKAIKAHRAQAVSAAAAMRAAAPAPPAGRAFKALTGAGRDRRVTILAAAAAVATAVAEARGGRAAAGGSPPGTPFWRLSLTAPTPEATRGSSIKVVLWGGGALRAEQRRPKQNDSPPFGVAAPRARRRQLVAPLERAAPFRCRRLLDQR